MRVQGGAWPHGRASARAQLPGVPRAPRVVLAPWFKSPLTGGAAVYRVDRGAILCPSRQGRCCSGLL